MPLAELVKNQALNVKNLTTDLAKPEGEVYEALVTIPMEFLKNPTPEEISQREKELAEMERDVIHVVALFALAAEMRSHGLTPHLSELDWQIASNLIKYDSPDAQSGRSTSWGQTVYFITLRNYMEILKADKVEIVGQPEGPLALTTLKLTKIVYDKSNSVESLPFPEERNF